VIMPDEWQLPTLHIGHRVEVHDTIPSTNLRAAELANDERNHGLVILAESQTAGRGQYGRVWQSPRGSSALLSVLLFPPAELRRPAIVTAWAAVAVGEAIFQTTGLQAAIKWPNDVLLHGRKVCGILIEQASAVVVGIGLNINQTAEDFALQQLPDAASLRSITGHSFDRDQVVFSLIHQLDAEYGRLLEGELTTLEACWKWRVGLLGRKVAADLFDGSSVNGRLLEMAFDGVVIDADEGPRVLQPEVIRHIFQSEPRA